MADSVERSPPSLAAQRSCSCSSRQSTMLAGTLASCGAVRWLRGPQLESRAGNTQSPIFSCPILQPWRCLLEAHPVAWSCLHRSTWILAAMADLVFDVLLRGHFTARLLASEAGVVTPNRAGASCPWHSPPFSGA
jgi:hypothetical protein